jgi:hypothetical protein
MVRRTLSPNAERIYLWFDAQKTDFFVEKIRDNYKDEREMQYQSQFWMGVFQLAEISAE